MILTYLGTPGAGKSLHTAKDIRFALTHGQLVMANFEINLKAVRMHKKSRFVYLDNDRIRTDPDLVSRTALEYFKDFGKNRKVLLVLDECQLLFDSRSWNAPGRSEWLAFFTLHRKILGIRSNVILITQNEKALDKRLLPLAEYYVVHRDLSRGSTGEMLLAGLFGFNLFVAKKIWRPGKEKVGVTLFRGSKKIFSLYDTYLIFHA